MKRIGIGIIIAVLAISFGSYLWLSREQPEKYTGPVDKITVAAAEYLTGVLVYIGEEQGYFEKNVTKARNN